MIKPSSDRGDRPPSIVLVFEGIGKYGGMASYGVNLATALQARGWQVNCIATNYRGEGFTEFGTRVACHDLSTVPLSLRKPFVAAAMVNQLAPDILLINHCSLMHYALPLLDAQTKPVVVLHSDDPAFYRIAGRFAGKVFRWVAPTPKLATEFAARFGIDVRRIQIIPHGIDSRWFSSPASDTTRIPGRLVFVGFIAENKGADLLPDILSGVLTKHPAASLAIVGYGPLRPALEEEFARRGLAERVTFTGKLPPEGVAQVMRESEMLLLPTQVEGFGLVIAEAMMCGTVPVISHLDGITDSIVAPAETGLLVNRQDAAGFAAAVSELLGNAPRRQRMGVAAAQAARERFSTTAMLDAYLSLFAEADDRLWKNPSGWIGWTFATARQLLKERLQHHPHRYHHAAVTRGGHE